MRRPEDLSTLSAHRETVTVTLSPVEVAWVIVELERQARTAAVLRGEQERVRRLYARMAELKAAMQPRAEFSNRRLRTKSVKDAPP
jgi:hypothetical protein